MSKSLTYNRYRNSSLNLYYTQSSDQQQAEALGGSNLCEEGLLATWQYYAVITFTCSSSSIPIHPQSET